jgi:hypothetical protein
MQSSRDTDTAEATKTPDETIADLREQLNVAIAERDEAKKEVARLKERGEEAQWVLREFEEEH